MSLDFNHRRNRGVTHTVTTITHALAGRALACAELGGMSVQYYVMGMHVYACSTSNKVALITSELTEGEGPVKMEEDLVDNQRLET